MSVNKLGKNGHGLFQDAIVAVVWRNLGLQSNISVRTAGFWHHPDEYQVG
jgi:hypothetical protein